MALQPLAQLVDVLPEVQAVKLRKMLEVKIEVFWKAWKEVPCWNVFFNGMNG